MMAAELLTLAECKKILERATFDEINLIDYKIVADNEVLGFLGDYYRLILHCQEGQQHKTLAFFLKSMPRQSAEVGKIKIFRKEAELYTTLLKDMQFFSNKLWSPKCYFTRSDLIVLQDLNSLNYKNCSHNEENLTSDEIKAILSALAGLHASSIVLEEKRKLRIDELYSLTMWEEITVSPNVAWFTTGLSTIMDLAKLHKSHQSQKAQQFISNELDAHLSTVYEMQNPSKKYRNVLCHRDPWRANALFNYSEMSAILVDFQTCRYCPPSMDIMLAIFLNQNTSSRIAFEEQYLLWYYEELKMELSQHRIGVDACLTFDELKSSYEDFKLFGLLYKAMTITITDVPKEIVTNEYKYVDRTAPLLSLMKSDAVLRGRMEASVGELVDYAMNRNKGK